MILRIRLTSKLSGAVALALYGWIGAVAAAGADPLDNWPQWRGPEGTGVAPRAHPPSQWSEQSHIRWKTELPGEGSSTPIIWEDQIFLLTAVQTDQVIDPPPQPDPRALTQPPPQLFRFLVLCLNRSSGEVRWQRTATEEVPHEGRHPTHSYAAASPVTDGKYLYVSFGSRGIFCYDLEGNLRWKRVLGRMRTRYGWGEGTSPTLHHDTLIVNWDHEDQSFIVGLDAASGAVKWKADRDEPTSWATPIVVTYRGRNQVIANGTTRVRSYDLETGQVIWECGGQTLNAIPSPVSTPEMVICMSGYKGNTVHAIPLSAEGDITGSDRILWSYDRGTPYVPSPLLYRDQIYFTHANSAVLTSLNIRSGAVVLNEERLPGLGTLYASPVAAGGMIYFVGRNGVTVVIRAGAKLEVVAKNELDAEIDGSPAVAGNQLFLRGRSVLYCIE